MTTSHSTIHPPRGVARFFWRLPIWFYRVHAGWLLSERFLLLEHTGRKSGEVRKNVLEVVLHDKVKDIYYIAAGFGPASDWYQNLLKTPQAQVQTGRRRVKVMSETLQRSSAESVIREYERLHPSALRSLAKLLGYQFKDGKVDIDSFVQTIPIVALTVIETINKEAGT